MNTRLAFAFAFLATACSTGPRTITDSTCAEKLDRLAGEANRGLKTAPGDGLKPDEVDSRIKAKKSEFRACVSGHVNMSDEYERTIKLGALIGKDGAVGNSCVEFSQLPNDKIDECIEGVLKGIRFPAPRGGVSVSIHYPFTFKKE